MLSGIDLPMIGAALLFGVVGVFALMLFRGWQKKVMDQAAQAAAVSPPPAEVGKKRALSMERRLAQAEEARRKAQWSRVRNQGRDARIESICAALPDQAKELRRVLTTTRVLDGNGVRTALRKINQGQGIGGNGVLLPPVIQAAKANPAASGKPATPPAAPSQASTPASAGNSPKQSAGTNAAPLPTAPAAGIAVRKKV